MAAKTQITLESLTEMYLADRVAAYKSGQLAVAKSAANSLAKMYGYFIERHEHGAAGDFEWMSDDAHRASITFRANVTSAARRPASSYVSTMRTVKGIG